jgi:membrane protein DedA with SNARE-associated domain
LEAVPGMGIVAWHGYGVVNSPEAPGRSNPRLPWIGRPRAVDIACWAGLALSGAYYFACLPFRAALVGTHPVLLEVLTGSTESIVAAAAFARVGRGSLTVVMLAAVPGLFKFIPLYWWAGKLWGERMIELVAGRSGRGLKMARRVQRWGRKFTWSAVVLSPFTPIPGALIYVVVGWAGMRLVTFLALGLISVLLWAGMLAGLGYALGEHAVVVAQDVSHYALWISIALVGAVIVNQLRPGRRAAAPVPVPASATATATATAVTATEDVTGTGT